jgi:hypothetical protein
MKNVFPIAPLKVLNSSYNTLQVYGSIPLFGEEFSVNWSLSNVTEVGSASMPTMTGSNVTTGSIQIKRSELKELSETAIVAVVAASVGAKLVN